MVWKLVAGQAIWTSIFFEGDWAAEDRHGGIKETRLATATAIACLIFMEEIKRFINTRSCSKERTYNIMTQELLDPMAHPQKTYELKIEFPEISETSRIENQTSKDSVREWLVANGVESFVDGTIDGIDIDNEFTGEYRDFYGELGGEKTPISIYKYSLESLQDLQARLDRAFLGRITTSMHSMDTEVWMEGWKESFLPISTKRFYVYPPWNKDPIPPGKIALVIEPGIAFGTGQHATTQICLQRLEALIENNPETFSRMLDVGTGTGILSVGALKLGCPLVVGTDIDPDAVMAARQNAALNAVSLPIYEMSVPDPKSIPAPESPPYDLVVANILTVVLEKIIPELARAVAPGGMLVLSGILAEDADMMTDLATPLGLQRLRKNELEGWVCLEFVKIDEKVAKTLAKSREQP